MPPKSKFSLTPVTFKSTGFIPSAVKAEAVKPVTEQHEAEAEVETHIENEPEKLFTKGADNEKELFRMRSKILRFSDTDKEWKERGVGDLCVFYNEEAKCTRVLMHREQTYKIACNFAVSTIGRKPEYFPDCNNKRIMIIAKDYSDDEPKISTFAVIFKQTEDAEKFMSVILEAREKEFKGVPEDVIEEDEKKEKKEEAVEDAPVAEKAEEEKKEN